VKNEQYPGHFLSYKIITRFIFRRLFRITPIEETNFTPYRIIGRSVIVYTPYRIIGRSVIVYTPYRIIGRYVIVYTPYRIIGRSMLEQDV
jgi:hypothetical protein